MDSIEAVIERARLQGISVDHFEDRLLFNAPSAVRDSPIAQELERRKEEVLRYLNGEPDPSELEKKDAIDPIKQKRERLAKIKETYHLDSPWSLQRLLDSDVKHEYLVDDLLVRHQAAVIAGASKSLKTTFSIALALAVASGQTFLDRFAVSSTSRVLICSAESGSATIKQAVIGLAKAMNIDLKMLVQDGRLAFCWWVPRVSNPEVLEYFSEQIRELESSVVMVDPLYQSLDDQQNSMVLNGQQLAALSGAITRQGSTPVMIDHVKRSSLNAREFSPLELEDISGAGKAEYFRQWVLLSRRSKYEPSESGPSTHQLWMTAGGSAGHSGHWSLDISEQRMECGGREYALAVAPRSETQRKAAEDRKATSASKKELAAKATEDRMQRKAKDLIEKVFAKNPLDGLTKNDIEDRLAVTSKEAGRIIAICLESGQIKLAPKSIEKNGRKYDGYRLADRLDFGSVGSGE